ncbi:PP2C family protein-serine/threonine phosphatase [Kitasatospora sp. NPDC051853]|uniref:PP2C family protein-serine/threonine phosphatase n=1 Tax=Kitasatospora sp. NPDC051853 TaxID=3364058 RepID=UPI0037B804A2
MGIPATVSYPSSVLAARWPDAPSCDLLLVDAALDVETVRRLIRELSRRTGRPPAVVAFSSGDVSLIEPHLKEGLDYLSEPFLPYLVRKRLDMCRQNRDLAYVLDEMHSAVDESRFERELQIGREIQRGFLPENLPELDEWDIAAYFEPAREVSGDFYDAYDVINGDFLAFAIADVCDKGIGAALFMALIRSLLRQAAVADEGLTAVPEPVGSSGRPLPGAALALRAVRTTNDYLTTNHLHQAYFATLFFGVVDTRTGELIYINCGHNAPVVQRATGEQLSLLPTGPALGLMRDAHFDLGFATLERGDLLYLYTDGVPEARNPAGEFLGEGRMLAMLADPGRAATVIERMRKAVAEHAGVGEQFDDITMLGLLRHPAGPGEYQRTTEPRDDGGDGP